MRRNSQGKRTVNFFDVLLVFVVITPLSLFFSTQLFWFMLGFTGILLFVYLVMVWDELIAWWTTRK